MKTWNVYADFKDGRGVVLATPRPLTKEKADAEVQRLVKGASQCSRAYAIVSTKASARREKQFASEK